MQKIVVTGAAGRIGRLMIADLLEHGYQTLGVDCVIPAPPISGPFLPANLVEPAAVYDVLSGADAVIHLALSPVPVRGRLRRRFTTMSLALTTWPTPRLGSG